MKTLKGFTHSDEMYWPESRLLCRAYSTGAALLLAMRVGFEPEGFGLSTRVRPLTQDITKLNDEKCNEMQQV